MIRELLKIKENEKYTLTYLLSSNGDQGTNNSIKTMNEITPL